MGIVTKLNRSTGEMHFFIQPRRSFSAGNRAVTTSAKQAKRARQRGKRVHRGAPPHFYAIIIETGHVPTGNPRQRSFEDPLGRHVRPADPFLAPEFDRMRTTVPPHFTQRTGQELAKLTK
jgi:hypothetical protein